MTTFLAQSSALSTSASSGGNTLGADAARAGRMAGTRQTRDRDGLTPRLPAGPARAVYVRKPEDWRLRGRTYDPRQRALSRGEQRVQAAERLIYGGSGVLAGLMVIYAIAAAVWWR